MTERAPQLEWMPTCWVMVKDGTRWTIEKKDGVYYVYRGVGLDGVLVGSHFTLIDAQATVERHLERQF